MLAYHLETAHWKANRPSVHSGPLHKYPYTFESATISLLGIEKYPPGYVWTAPQSAITRSRVIQTSQQVKQSFILNRRLRLFSNCLFSFLLAIFIPCIILLWFWYLSIFDFFQGRTYVLPYVKLQPLNPRSLAFALKRSNRGLGKCYRKRSL